MRITTRAAVLIGVLLAVAPAACGLGGGDAEPSDDPSQSTVFRTITVAIDTSSPTTTVPPPSLDQSAAASAGGNVYVVQPGDAWWFIADKLGVATEALLAANSATLQTWLHPGEYLRVPTTSDG